MAELKNKWSVTRDRHFQECRRLFYLSHYAFWGGWQLNADDFTKSCYRFTKMKNLDTWAGEIVHDQIQDVLSRVRFGQPVDLDSVIAGAVNKLRTGWVQSKNEEWRVDPKRRVNLFEHYYNRDVPRERTDDIKQRVIQCLENFWRSPVFEFIRHVQSKDWKSLEDFQEFELGHFTIIVKMDLAFEHDGRLYIYDWKTGQQDGKDVMQLVCYALYAMKVWGYRVDQIKIVLAYLRDNVFQEYQPSPQDIIEAQDRILEGCHQMQASLTDPRANVASIENFPMTFERGRCQRCFFWEACYGDRQMEP
jgi:hypothetical protein